VNITAHVSITFIRCYVETVINSVSKYQLDTNTICRGGRREREGGGRERRERGEGGRGKDM
jgi:hypothetical protein